MDLGLKGKRAIVTGGTRGIGRAIADLLAAEGCSVAICARNAAQVEEAVSAFRGKGVQAFGSAVDVADGEAFIRFIQWAAGELGGLDIFISNVSAMGGGGIGEAAWKRGFEVDVLGAVRGCETALPFFEKSGGGSIVLLGSTAAVEVVGPRRAYSGFKAAILPYAKSLARNLASTNVRVNVVSPGTVYFKGGTWENIEIKAPERYRQAIERNPTGRMADPQEVAAAVVFLASPRASFISGANLICDGAMTQRVQF